MLLPHRAIRNAMRPRAVRVHALGPSGPLAHRSLVLALSGGCRGHGCYDRGLDRVSGTEESESRLTHADDKSREREKQCPESKSKHGLPS